MSAVTPTTGKSACPTCGTIQKSGKPSCCGHGGSWFKRCGGGGNRNLDHSWHEGIKACKAQSQPVIGQQPNAAERNVFGILNSKAVVTAASVPIPIGKTATESSKHSSQTQKVHNMSDMSANTPSPTQENTAATAPGCKILLYIATCICILLPRLL